MEIAYFLFFIICIILFAIGFYNIGRRKTVQEKEINYQKELKQKEKIELDLKNKKQQLQQIEKEYADKKQIIEDTSNIAQREYNLREQALEEKYKTLNDKLKQQYDNNYAELQERYKKHQELYSEQLKMYNNELASIKNTRAAAIKAFQLEAMSQEERNQFRLNVSDSDLNDVKILETVRPRLNKPRVLNMLIWQTFYQPLAKKKFPAILGDKPICGIYKITNLKDEKVYIGQAKDCRKRWLDHCKHGLGIDTPSTNKLYQAMLQDGLENFTFELLEECSEDQLDKNEQYFIEMFSSVEWGYNSRKQIG